MEAPAAGGVAPPGRWARLRRRTKSGLAVVGFLTVGGAVLEAVAARKRLKAGLPDEGFVLELDLEQNRVVEHARHNPLAALLDPQGKGTLQLRSVTEALHAAGGDERVKGLVALVGASPGGLGFAQTQELRGAVQEFRRRAGSRAVTLAYSDAFGEGGGGGTGAYYLASACEFVAMMPTGLVSATGLAATQTYARGLLDRWRVRPFFFAREEYKSAASFLVDRSSTKPQNEALRSVLDSLFAQIVAGVAAGRGLPAKQVQAAIDGAPHSALDAQRLGLIDAQLYRDQALKLVSRIHEARHPPTAEDSSTAGDMPSAAAGASCSGQVPQGLLPCLLADPDAEAQLPLKHVPLKRYVTALAEQRRQREAAERAQRAMTRLRALKDSVLEVTGWAEMLRRMRTDDEAEEAAAPESSAAAAAGDAAQQAERGQHVALFTLTGPIYLGTPTSPVPSGPAAAQQPTEQIASLPVIGALRKARQDPAVKAVVLRVDSPGGSAAASDAIHREVLLLRQAGKPVVVSMGNTAASGGYFISCAANKIVAQAGTITGSIGVLAGKLVFDEALREYGITTETTKAGRNADALSAVTHFDKQQRRKLDSMIDDIYAHFKQRVAQGRGLSDAAVAQAAKGRVWTGEQALALGLVDELGGLDSAIVLAKREAGLPEEEGAVPVKQIYPERKSALAQLAKVVGGDDDSKGSAAGEGGKRGGTAAALGAAAAAVGVHLTAGEWALLAQGQGGMVGPQYLDVSAERLAAAV